jgi:lipoyl(octanoyl) transferase
VGPAPRTAVVPLGLLPYRDAFALQRSLVSARYQDEIEDVLLLLEHPPTITHSFTGRGAQNLLAEPDLLRARGVVVEETDRGGDITFHGPGQLVGYPILKLREEAGERDLHQYLRNVENLQIRTAAAFGVESRRIPGRTGIWAGPLERPRKLGAIGVKASRWVTLHGFALNVTTDLSFFDLIVPCGIADAGVTSLLAELGSERTPSMADVREAAAEAFASVFGRTPSPPSEALRILLPS